ncbi:MAG: hypothetical protein SV775_16330 [Thermodesulfobacteriota bacterium]|nr:hypothetical protein [Thermodesulfobacteriota bacterium]
MKVITGCVICMKNASKEFNSTGESTSVKFYPADMDNNGIVHLKCDNGHNTAGILIGSKHQFLFESGCRALIDTYANEAVSSFSAALERTYEFFIRVACRKLGLTSDLIESTWKNVKSQSERQFGAFLFLYPTITGESFKLQNEIPEFRNKVIHKGYIARSEEVLDYAEKIFFLIRQIVAVLNDKCSNEMWEEINEGIEVQKKVIPSNMEWTYLSVTPFDLRKDLTFESWVDELKTT